jgi:hypothetical protein
VRLLSRSAIRHDIRSVISGFLRNSSLLPSTHIRIIQARFD